MATVRKHVFLLIGLAVIAYFFSIDITSLKPGLLEYSLFAVGFLSMAIYVGQSFLRLRETMKNSKESAQ